MVCNSSSCDVFQLRRKREENCSGNRVPVMKFNFIYIKKKREPPWNWAAVSGDFLSKRKTII